MVHQYVWDWLWAIPPVVAALLNLKLAWRVPNRSAADLLSGLLLIPVELYLIMRVACATAGWAGLAGVTALQTLMMVVRILRPTRGLRL